MPRLKFTKEVVVEAGYELMKKEGFQNVSVRKIANYLKCSTAPIYFNFNTVDELKEEIIDKCKEKLKKYLLVLQFLQEKKRNYLGQFFLIQQKGLKNFTK